MTDQNNIEEFRPKDKSFKSRFSTLGLRALVALAGIPLMLGMSYLGGFWLAGLVAALSFLGLWEFYGLARAKGLYPLTWWGLSGGMILLAFLGLRWQFLLALLVLWVMLIMSRMVFRDEVKESISRIGITIMGVLYIPFLFGHMLLLRTDYSFTGYKLLFFSYGPGLAVRHRGLFFGDDAGEASPGAAYQPQEVNRRAYWRAGGDHRYGGAAPEMVAVGDIAD